MTPNESIFAVPVSGGGFSAATVAPGSDFDARWEAWRARGIVHERAVRRKLVVVASLGGTIATASAIAYAFLRP